MKGYIKGIISSESTENEEIMTYPITVASAVYCKNGEQLEKKVEKLETKINNSTFPNKWANKNIFCFGDSITSGGYPTYIGKTLGAFVTNKGSSGGTYARDFDIIKSTDLTYAHAVTIMTGHNRGAGNMTLEESGLLDISNVYDFNNYPDNYYGGIGKIINYIRRTYPNTKIYLLGLHYTTREDTSKQCQRALKEIGDYYSVSFIDVYANCGISKTNLNVYSDDGTHLNDSGNKMLGECIAYQMAYL